MSNVAKFLFIILISPTLASTNVEIKTSFISNRDYSSYLENCRAAKDRAAELIKKKCEKNLNGDITDIKYSLSTGDSRVKKCHVQAKASCLIDM